MPSRRAVTACAGLMLCSVAAPLSAQAPVRAAIRGTVFDSVTNAPLARALVRLVRADDPSVGRSATTDDRGAFAYDTVSAGVWLASFSHPVLDSLQLEPAIVRLDITDSSDVTMPLATPSARTLVQLACRDVPTDAALLTGVIRDPEDDTPLVGATVEVEWPEWVLSKKQLATELQRRRATTDSLGRYTLCGAPSGSTLRARSWTAQDSAGIVEVTVPESGYAVQDFHVSTTRAIAGGAEGLATPTAESATRARGAVVRGRITTTAGAPLPNAIVTVLGSGSAARTNDAGEFRISDATAGSQSLEARAIGYSPVHRAVRLRETQETVLELTMATRRVELDTVRVSADFKIPYDVQNIERRWRAGMGTFLDAGRVRDRTALFVTDALRGMNGVFVRPIYQGYGQSIFMRGNSGRECRAMLFLDGMPWDAGGRGGATIDEVIAAADVAMVEVYPRPTMVPAEYLTMARDCGVVAVWSKRFLGNVALVPPKSAR